MKVAEEYFRSVTQAVGLSFCGWSHSKCVRAGFQLDSLVCTCIITIMYIQLCLAQNSTCAGYFAM